jgi:hypothetical protein
MPPKKKSKVSWTVPNNSFHYILDDNMFGAFRRGRGCWYAGGAAAVASFFGNGRRLV